MNGIKRRAEQFRGRINASHQMPPLNLRSDLECCLTPDDLGREIRRVWVDLARQEPNPKPAHLVEWDELDERNRAIDREIGQALARIILTNTVCNLCLRSGRGPSLSDDEIRHRVRGIAQGTVDDLRKRSKPIPDHTQAIIEDLDAILGDSECVPPDSSLVFYNPCQACNPNGSGQCFGHGQTVEEREDAPLPADIASDNPDDWAIEAEQNQEGLVLEGGADDSKRTNSN